MANLLATPGLWHVDFAAPPPSSWNGTAYAITVGSGTTATFQLLYNGSQPAAGDVISGSILFTSTEDPPPAGQCVMVLFDSVASEVLNFIPVTYGQASTFSFDTDSYGGANWAENSGVALLLQEVAETPDGFPSYFYGLQLALTPLGTPPPQAVGPVYVVPHHLRAYSGYDTPLAMWVRDEAGRADLSQDVVSVVVSTYQGGRQLYRCDAATSAAGEVTWTHPASIARQHRPGVYRVKVVSSLRGVIGDGLLEVA